MNFRSSAWTPIDFWKMISQVTMDFFNGNGHYYSLNLWNLFIVDNTIFLLSFLIFVSPTSVLRPTSYKCAIYYSWLLSVGYNLFEWYNFWEWRHSPHLSKVLPCSHSPCAKQIKNDVALSTYNSSECHLPRTVLPLAFPILVVFQECVWNQRVQLL